MPTCSLQSRLLPSRSANDFALSFHRFQFPHTERTEDLAAVSTLPARQPGPSLCELCVLRER